MSEGNAEDRYDVCIVGTGRVGLPLGLSLCEAGLRVAGLDVDPALRDSVNAGRMPFAEPGYDELVASLQLKVTDDASVVTRSDAIVITVGTPLHTHIETDLDQIRRVLDGVGPPRPTWLSPEHCGPGDDRLRTTPA